MKGEVTVAKGDVVRSTDIVARTELPGRVHITNLVNQLGVLPADLRQRMKIQPGHQVKEGDVVASKSILWGLFSSEVVAPIDGHLESLSTVTGQAIWRQQPIPVEVTAYIDGEIAEVIEGEGVIIESDVALVQGIFGLAGEVYAPLVIGSQPGQPLQEKAISSNWKGKIVVVGGKLGLGVLRIAMDMGVVGIIAGAMEYQDVRDLLGYDIGVAVTGNEDLPTTIMMTEGFGSIPMDANTFSLLQRLEGRNASMNGATQIRAGVQRPEIVVARDDQDTDCRTSVEGESLAMGSRVRCVRAPYFGRIGKVVGLPKELFILPSETKVRVVEVQIEEDTVMVPRANVEIMTQW